MAEIDNIQNNISNLSEVITDNSIDPSQNINNTQGNSDSNDKEDSNQKKENIPEGVQGNEEQNKGIEQNNKEKENLQKNIEGANEGIRPIIKKKKKKRIKPIKKEIIIAESNDIQNKIIELITNGKLILLGLNNSTYLFSLF